MATGKTNARWIKISLEDNTPTARVITPYVSSIDGFGLTYETQDVTGYSDGWTNVTLGHPSGDVTISGPVDNTAAVGSHIVFSAIAGDQTTVHSLIVDIGIKAAAGNGDPRWTANYYCSQYTVNADATYSATLVPAGSSVGAWSTVP